MQELSTKDRVMREIRKGVRRLTGRSAEADEGRRDYSEKTLELFAKVAPYTMTSNPRIHAVERSIRYIVEANIPGDIVECGVWRGGSSMAAAYSLMDAGDTSRTLWLFDTFDGMPKPTNKDLSWTGSDAMRRWSREADGSDKGSKWLRVDVEEVRQNLNSTGYPADNITLTKGMVQDTLPGNTVGDISLLRLDTDFYESTKIELELLWPKLSKGGVLIVDDYGRWLGQREAVDAFFKEQNLPILLSRIDEYGYMAQKL